MICCATERRLFGIPPSTRGACTTKISSCLDRREARVEYGIGRRSSIASDARVVSDNLIRLLSGEERGLRTLRNVEKQEKIFQTIGDLAAIGAHSVTTDDSLTEEWRMLWTTEKETLFILEKAPLFGTRAGDVLQIIDVSRGTLRNVIRFPPTGMFVVNATVEVASALRMNFRFTGASLLVGGWKLPIPPFGQGWFESLYLDEKIRVSKDSRGNYLVCGRASCVSAVL